MIGRVVITEFFYLLYYFDKCSLKVIPFLTIEIILEAAPILFDDTPARPPVFPESRFHL